MEQELLKNKNIKLVVSDFDGIFTDGKLTVYSNGLTSKVIDYQDIMAIANILKRDIKFAVISGEKSAAIDTLKEKFPLIETFQNERNKISVLKQLLEKYNINKENTLYIGDDINDIECLQYAGNSATVMNAHQSVKKLNNIYISSKFGGNGAFREIADLIL